MERLLERLKNLQMSLKLLNSLSEEAYKDIEIMHPLGIGDVEDVANACIYLLLFVSKVFKACYVITHL